MNAEQDYSLQVLVLYLERLAKQLGLHFPRRALVIQRLEGSRPQRSLCTLNRPERVQRDHGQAEFGAVGSPEVRTEGPVTFRSLIRALERLASKGFWPDETRHPGARRSTGKDRGCG
jgi:hypothetical protein